MQYQKSQSRGIFFGLMLVFAAVAVFTTANFTVHAGLFGKLKTTLQHFLPPTTTPTEEPTDTPLPTETPNPHTPTETTQPTSTPNPALSNLPSSKILTGFKHEYQQWNNCGPVTTKIILSYYGINKSQAELAKYFRGGWARDVYDDKHVPTTQISQYLEKFNLKSIIRVNGDIDKIKALIANDIPVVTYQLLHTNDDIGHYSVVKGYDSSSIYFSDSYDGPHIKRSYDQFNRLWAPKNFRYMPVYKPEKEAVVKSILGDDFDKKTSYKNALAYELQQLKTSNRFYHWMNAGECYYVLEEWEKAREYFEKAKSIGLPRRELWYVSWPITVYNHLGQYQKVIDMVEAVRDTGNKYPAELLYEKAYAQWKLGEKDKALATLKTAIYYEPNYSPLKELKQEIENA